MERMEAERRLRLEEEARMAVQVMEYNGGVYLCIYGIPLLGGEGANEAGLVELVTHARNNYKSWKEAHYGYKN